MAHINADTQERKEFSISIMPMCLPKTDPHHGWQDTRDDVYTLRLSSIDQGLVRSYVRMGLCYPLSNNQSPSTVSGRLQDFISETVQCLPHLSGKVVVVKDAAQQDTIAVQFSRSDVFQYKPIIRHLTKEEFPFSYGDLSLVGMPADALISDKLNLMPNKPDETTGPAPVLVIQANFIRGGLIVTLYLHHSVGDGLTLAHIIRGVFRNGFRKVVDINNDKAVRAFLKDDAASRAQMSADNGKKPDWSRLPLYRSIDGNSAANCRDFQSRSNRPSQPDVKVFSFSVSKLKALKVAINQSIPKAPGHAANGQLSYPTYVSTFNVLASLLWRNIVRARLTRLDKPRLEDWALVVPVNIRGRMRCPLPDSYLGNGVSSSMTRLNLRDILSQRSFGKDVETNGSSSTAVEHASDNGTIEEFATLTPHVGKLAPSTDDLVDSIRPLALALRSEISKIDSSYTENLIAVQHSLPEANLASRLNVDFETDVFITTWVDMPVYSASDLGLGLGNAEWARKASAVKEAYGALILEPRTYIGPDGTECKVLEVMMQLREDDIEHIRHNEELMHFVEHVI